jgi:tight adherence protein C
MSLEDYGVLRVIAASMVLALLVGTMLDSVVRRGSLTAHQRQRVVQWLSAGAAHVSHRPAVGLLDVLVRVGGHTLGVRPIRSLLRRLMTEDMRSQLDQLLHRAGLQDAMQPEQVVAGQLLLGVVFIALYILGFGITSAFDIFAALVLGLAGYFGPAWLLRTRARRRQARIGGELTGAADIIAVIMSGGAGLEHAFRLYFQHFTGPLAQELRLTSEEISLGRPRREALLGLADRIDIDPLRQFVTTILHAERFGQPLAQTLREQARQLKIQRRQWVQAELARAPVRMLVPLATFLLPALLLILLGPMILQILEHGIL